MREECGQAGAGLSQTPADSSAKTGRDVRGYSIEIRLLFMPCGNKGAQEQLRNTNQEENIGGQSSLDLESKIHQVQPVMVVQWWVPSHPQFPPTVKRNMPFGKRGVSVWFVCVLGWTGDMSGVYACFSPSHHWNILSTPPDDTSQNARKKEMDGQPSTVFSPGKHESNNVVPHIMCNMNYRLCRSLNLSFWPTCHTNLQ